MKFSRLFSTIDTHTCGQPTRTITSGIPPIPGSTVVDKMLYLKKHMDWIRTALMFEPRGHSIMSGVILVEPSVPGVDYGVIFIETGGYLPMCGHDTIGVCTALVETGMVNVQEPETKITLETPAGLTKVVVRVENGKALSVTFRNIPSFVIVPDARIQIPGYGEVILDVSYGGNPYAIVSADLFDLELVPEKASEIITTGRIVRDAVNTQVKTYHPEKPFIETCTHVEFFSKATSPAAHAKNAVFFADSGIDRSPCGTGTSAKVATLYSKGLLGLNEEFVHESIIGSLFRAKVVEETAVGPFKAVVPEVTGSAYIIGFNHIVIDPDDPHKNGFLLN